MDLRQTVAFSDHWAARSLKAAYRAPRRFSIPAPRFLIVSLRTGYEFLRDIVYFLLRVFWAEPMFKSYCTRYGKGLHTDIFAPWVEGKGEIIAGDGVSLLGKCSFKFAARYAHPPRLIIGDHTGFGHLCSFTVGKEISIGKHCRIASGVIMFDASGHPLDPASRMRGDPASSDDVRPIRIGDNVWIGRGAAIFPGVTIGENSVIAAYSVVIGDVPPNTIVAGNPARKTGVLAHAQHA